MKKKYSTLFPGMRDHYQIPISLFESDRLDLFITDFYNKGFLKVFFSLLGDRNPLKRRYSEVLKTEKVISIPFFRPLIRLLEKGMQSSMVTVWEDHLYAKIAVHYASKRKSNLILYEFQAEYAFNQKFKHPITRILFQFHPHPIWEHPILLEDAKDSPELYSEVVRNTRNNLPEPYRSHTYTSWKNADHVIVASGITKKSLIMAGCPPERITIVPYGFGDVDTLSSEPLKANEIERPFFLFVGSGTYRKGLHHLCNAWKNTNIALTHDLLVIARTVDPSIKPYLKFKGIRWMAGVSKDELTRYFQNALCFVMPSLSEGFGQVYLEALANGCPVIGSSHSMLPDIIRGSHHILFVDPTQEAEISSALQKVFNTPSSDNFFNKDAIRALVIPYTWENFRAGINQILEKYD